MNCGQKDASEAHHFPGAVSFPLQTMEWPAMAWGLTNRRWLCFFHGAVPCVYGMNVLVSLQFISQYEPSPSWGQDSDNQEKMNYPPSNYVMNLKLPFPLENYFSKRKAII